MSHDRVNGDRRKRIPVTSEKSPVRCWSLEGNRISNGGRSDDPSSDPPPLDTEEEREWATGSSRSLDEMQQRKLQLHSVFCESVVLHRPNRLIFVLPPSLP
ncbi:hypothetical protein EVAR_38508_1 [Eumeta japonica]|uniref:Uncharacterized protein n=1 Tax=Eumeta variegata TaxID=151549 RepID=A0A4C1WAX5_EUMVA|nr:hypothetical protein EVAR_38508_1 [Eumeta japonica]